jgi:hypothetical protein
MPIFSEMTGTGRLFLKLNSIIITMQHRFSVMLFFPGLTKNSGLSEDKPMLFLLIAWLKVLIHLT